MSDLLHHQNLIELLTSEQRVALTANAMNVIDLNQQIPIAYLRLRSVGYRFLLTQIDPKSDHIFYGLCDFNTEIYQQFYSFQLIKDMAAKNKEAILVDKNFKATHSIADFQKVAEAFGTVLVDDTSMEFQHTLESLTLK